MVSRVGLTRQLSRAPCVLQFRKGGTHPPPAPLIMTLCLTDRVSLPGCRGLGRCDPAYQVLHAVSPDIALQRHEHGRGREVLAPDPMPVPKRTLHIPGFRQNLGIGSFQKLRHPAKTL